RWDVAHSNPKTERWRKCSARHLPNYISIRKNVLALPRNSLLHHLETNSNSTRSFFLQAHDRILTHKIRLLQTNNPVKPRLDRRSVLINIISIETHSRLKSQNISSTQPDRRNPYLSTTRQQFLPDLHRISWFLHTGIPHIDLETILTRVSAPRQEARNPVNLRILRPIFF